MEMPWGLLMKWVLAVWVLLCWNWRAMIRRWRSPRAVGSLSLGGGGLAQELEGSGGFVFTPVALSGRISERIPRRRRGSRSLRRCAGGGRGIFRGS